MRAINISLMVLRLAVLLTLILGILFWTGNFQNLTLIHMLLGFIVVISLWVIGLAQGFTKGGSFGLAVATLDRKSTRLNSSHANISYAVFCLKKKNKRKYTKIIQN